MTNPQLVPLVNIVTTDLAAITRGRPVSEARLAKAFETGIGWVPANLCITAFNAISEDNPWGSSGDLRIMPDPNARYATASTGSETPLDIVIGNITELDGSPWPGCSRTQLKEALAALKAATGLSMIAAFEQEFVVCPASPDPAAVTEHAFSIGAIRGMDPFAPRLTACLEEAGVEPEMVLAEYGAHQFEVTCAPTEALAAADRAVAIRELAREVARNLGHRASFVPKPKRNEVGNGVHIHFSFADAEGRPATYDPAKPGGLSDAAGAFCAGVLKHLPAIIALTASTTPSFYRLAPHNWSSSYTWLGERDREATLRICPTVTIGGRDPSRQFNIEYRAADATANPYLALAAIVRAGLAGIEGRLSSAPIVSGDPSLMSDEELAEKGLWRLPETLEAALAALEADPVVCSWFPPELVASFLSVKRAEIKMMEGRDEESICAAYGERY
ncbi:glutamine synthetase family protein [Mesorhizobium sp. RP14(2022)]|uniref:Glutamine synthetase family protein n=1 Tax=Mesorhizobium liriopis TaxID=2953882 RepID=A0ABT1C1S1_9HYPH|nr:glutamine synthetase family protein [Mesorhizobium liriopis]MCO6048764.1 glutamine synthetase family protein [Mesorhizobium liriopis]